MQRHIVSLKFHSPLHVGTDDPLIGIEGVQPTVHSDTLFSGMINVWARLPGGSAPRVEDVIGEFEREEPPFRVSSCFPYYGADWFLPRPLTFHKEHYDPSKRWRYSKPVKEHRFIPYRYFRNWCAGQTVLKEVAGEMPEMSRAYTQTVIPRVALDRVNFLSQIFHCGLVYFSEGCGLYFLLEVQDDEWLTHIDLVLRLLGESGIGGERSLGCGRFTHELLLKDIEKQDSNWADIFSDTRDANAHCLLSLYYPRESEQTMFQNAGKRLAYGIVPRRGWTYSSVVDKQLKRRSCNMLGEGSVVPKKPVGELARVTPCGFPGHEVYRYGYAMSVPIKVHEPAESEGSHG